MDLTLVRRVGAALLAVAVVTVWLAMKPHVTQPVHFSAELSAAVADGPYEHAWPLLAMVHQRLGHPVEAREWLGHAARALEDPEFQRRGWERRLTMRRLTREARELIAPTQP